MSLIIVPLYYIIILGALAGVWFVPSLYAVPCESRVALACASSATAGGILYCLRAVYINKCVKKQWSQEWLVWYFLRPIVSMLMGFAASFFLYCFIQALEAHLTEYSFLVAFAFIVGYLASNIFAKGRDNA